jgi:phospholipid transport system substrate-binding protein
VSINYPITRVGECCVSVCMNNNMSNSINYSVNRFLFSFRAWLAAVCVFLAPYVVAEDVEARNVGTGDVETEVRQVVEDSTQLLVEKLSKEKTNYTENPERFYSEMDVALSGLVDFKRVAARVMGKYARKATKEQRSRFLASFKRSLYVAYSKALVESGVFEISVVSAKLNPRSDKKASVNLVVTSASGNQYPVVYSMHLAKSNEWMLENVIVNGVNVGLAFRDRFNQEVRAQKGDLDMVINNWSSKVELEDVSAGMDKPEVATK